MRFPHPPDGLRPLALAGRARALARAHPAARDVALAVAAKLVVLGLLQAAFFSHPAAPDMSLPPADVARAMLGGGPAVPTPEIPDDR